MAALPSFIQSSNTAASYCRSTPDNDYQPQLLHHRRRPIAKSELVDNEYHLSELRNSVVDHADMLAADRDPVCPSVEVQHLPSLYRASAGSVVDARNSGYPGHDDYYRNMAADFASYQSYPSAILSRQFGNGYCRSSYADKCAARRCPPVDTESYFHPGSVQPTWARLPDVTAAFPFPVGVGPPRHEYGTPAVTSDDCCRTDVVAGRSCCGQKSVDGGSSGEHRRRSTVSERSPTVSGAVSACCRLDSTDGATVAATTSDSTTTSSTTSKSSTTLSTTTSTAPVVVYPWMTKLHSRANNNNGKSVPLLICWQLHLSTRHSTHLQLL